MIAVISITAAVVLAGAPATILFYRVRSGNRPRTWGNYVTGNIVASFWFLGLTFVAGYFDEILGGVFYWELGIIFCGIIAYFIVITTLLPWHYEDY